MAKVRIDIELLLRHLGISAKREGSKWISKCPDPDHVDKKPSWSIVDQPSSQRHGSHHCFSCGYGGGPWELAASVWGVDVKQAGERVTELFRAGGTAEAPRVIIPNPRVKKVFKLPLGVVIPSSIDEWYSPALKYLVEERGITQAQILKWGIGYAIYGRCRLRVVFPVYTGGVLRTYSARAFASGIRRYDAGKEIDGAQPKEALFGEPYFDGGEVATIAEGCFSVLALERAGAPNPCGILSSELTPGRILALSRFRRILVCSDPDAAGDKVFEAIKGLSRTKELIRLRFPKSPDDMPIEDMVSFFV